MTDLTRALLGLRKGLERCGERKQPGTFRLAVVEKSDRGLVRGNTVEGGGSRGCSLASATVAELGVGWVAPV